MLNLTKNLVLQSIEANNWKHDDQDREVTICWALHFQFFGIDGFSAFITDDAIARDYPSFQMVESDEAELHESFTDAIDQKWEAIVADVTNWEKENFKEQTAIMCRIEKNRAEAGLV